MSRQTLDIPDQRPHHIDTGSEGMPQHLPLKACRSDLVQQRLTKMMLVASNIANDEEAPIRDTVRHKPGGRIHKHALPLPAVDASHQRDQHFVRRDSKLLPEFLRRPRFRACHLFETIPDNYTPGCQYRNFTHQPLPRLANPLERSGV